MKTRRRDKAGDIMDVYARSAACTGWKEREEPEDKVIAYSVNMIPASVIGVAM
jgi:hypothetical protein